MHRPFNLQRFVDAQDPVFAEVIAELTNGRKTSHWMWFVFPQIAGLGSSPTAKYFAIGSLEEAKAYLEHDVLGPRLRQCTSLANQIQGRSIGAIFGQPDDMKFHSSMTLFAMATGDNAVFLQALERYFDGAMDAGTLARL